MDLHMKLRKKTIAKTAVIFTSLFLLADSFPALTANADNLPEETAVPPESGFMFEEGMPEETQALTAELITEEFMTETQALLPSEKELSQEIRTITEKDSYISSCETTLQELTENVQDIVNIESTTQNEASLPETADITQNITEEEIIEKSSETALQEQKDGTKETKSLEFHASVEYTSQGYLVRGTFTEFPPNIIQIQPLSSQNNKSYQECDVTWDLQMIEAFQVAEKKQLICLHSNFEPLKSYLESSLDRFYLKLHLTDNNGILYETQTVLIDRGNPQSLPEEITASAIFASNVRARETKPFRYYGRYQITVKETATPKEITSVLPDTLPVEVHFTKEDNAYATGLIDCPVIWKTLSPPSLIAGESVTIGDAAKEIIVPADTLVHTPVGIFRLTKPLNVGDDIFVTDEVRLVLNVVSKDEKPTGVLSAEKDGLELAFHQKPTGATSIQVYTISENEKKWAKLPERCGLALLDAVNAQPSTANSGYALVLSNEQEPYRSYLTAQSAGEQPTPFFVGLKIKGGVYDGQELILAWPDSYELPLQLPKLGGAGGNESNAGAANKGDSTSEGQRPNLPQNTDTKKEEQTSALSLNQTPENIENITNITIESMEELPPQPDIENQQTMDDKKKASAFTQSPSKAQAAIVSISEENTSETDTTADTQSDAYPKSASVLETPPDTNKLSAALISSGQSETPATTTKTKNHQLFLWIMAAAIIGLGIMIHTCKALNAPSERNDKRFRNFIHRLSIRK